MRAVRYDAVGQVPELVDVPAPACPHDGVVVEVGASGVCRSDWHAWLGHDPGPVPIVPGHEFAGTVVEVGPGVTRWRAGDRVTVPFACGCGRCSVCAVGDTHVCPDQVQPGFSYDGSWAQRVAVHAADANVVALPDGLGWVEAAALGCRFATAYRAVVAQARVGEGQWLAVHGCGGVGLSAVMVGAALGARVVAVDVSARALEAAREAGAEHVVDASGLDPVSLGAQVRELSHGGAHASVDALGGVPLMTASIASLRRRGRHVQVGLMLQDASVAPVPMGRVLAEELEILGSHGMPARDYPEMLGRIASGALDVSRLVGRVIPLDEAPAAMVAMNEPAPGSGVTVIDLAL